MNKRRKHEPTNAVGKWEFTLDRNKVHESARATLVAVHKRTEEIREEAHLKRVAAFSRSQGL